MIQNKEMKALLAKSALEKYEDLTDREMEVIKYIWEGYFNNEIATLLKLSVKTVEVHRANIMLKYRTKNVIQMIRIAIAKEIIKIKE